MTETQERHRRIGQRLEEFYEKELQEETKQFGVTDLLQAIRQIVENASRDFFLQCWNDEGDTIWKSTTLFTTNAEAIQIAGTPYWLTQVIPDAATRLEVRRMDTGGEVTTTKSFKKNASGGKIAWEETNA